jgi:hypothetical protein
LRVCVCFSKWAIAYGCVCFSKLWNKEYLN